MMKTRLTVLALILAVSAYVLTPLSAARAVQGGNPLKSIAITGMSGGNQVFTGTFDVTQFTHKGNQILATGTLKGTLTKADGLPGKLANKPLCLSMWHQARARYST